MPADDGGQPWCGGCLVISSLVKIRIEHRPGVEDVSQLRQRAVVC